MQLRIVYSNLMLLGSDIEMEFGVCTVTVKDKNIKYKYDENFIKELNETKFEKKLKKSELPTSSFWNKQSNQTQWINQSLFNYLFLF